MNRQPNIIPRAQHNISRKNIEKCALRVLYHLTDHGYQAYLVGGCIRDLLLGIQPKDFDVVTDATPEQIKKIFKNCRLIGRRFRLAHIYFGRHIIEVATFRSNADGESEHRAVKNGMLVRDNRFGTIEEDAWRRDFGINALYYNIADFTLIDYVGAMADFKKKQIHILGNPVTRYQEDPVRILRAIRFAAKLQFAIAKATAEGIKKSTDFLENVPTSRLLDELIKLFHCGHARKAYKLLKSYGVFEYLLPQTYERWLADKKGVDTLLTGLCKDTDKRLQSEKTVSPIYLHAVLLWPAVYAAKTILMKEGKTPAQALVEASYQVMCDQNCVTSLPKRFQQSIHQIWRLQYRLQHPKPRNYERTVGSSRFRAALDLLRLRAQAYPELKPASDWWEGKGHF